MDDLERLQLAYQERRLEEAWSIYTAAPVQASAEFHFWGAVTASTREQWYQAKAAIDLAASLPCDPEVEAKVQHQVGYVHRYTGDLFVALRAFDRCLRLLQDLPDLRPLLQGPCLYNKALTLEHLPGKGDAAETYRAAIAVFEAEGMTLYRRMALQNLAWVYCEQGKPEAAAAALDEAEPLCQDTDSRRRQRLVRAYVAHLEDDTKVSMALCKSLLTEEDVPADVRCLAACIASMAALNHQLIREAEGMLWMAQELMMQPPIDSRCRSMVSSVFQRLHSTKLLLRE